MVQDLPPETPPPQLSRQGGETQIPTPLTPLPLQVQGATGQPATTLAEVCANHRGEEALTAYPVIFNILKKYGDLTATERMPTLTSLSIQ